MTAVGALPHCIPNLDLSLHCRGNDTWHADVLGYFVALKTAQLGGHFIRIDLHLKLGTLLHLQVVWLEYFSVVHDLGRTLKSLDELGGPLFELSGELIVESLQF